MLDEKSDMLMRVYENNKEYAESHDSVDMLKKIMNSMDLIDRKFFVKNPFVYKDIALSIGQNQTISQPSTVARMLMMADLKPKLDVLEIGSGSGWNASLLSYLVNPGKVISAERIERLYDNSIKNFKKMTESTGLKLNVEFLYRDIFSMEWKEKFNRIITTAGADMQMAEKLRNLGREILKNKGLLIYPTRDDYGNGDLEVWKKDGGMKRTLREKGYTFVPLLEGIR